MDLVILTGSLCILPRSLARRRWRERVLSADAIESVRGPKRPLNNICAAAGHGSMSPISKHERQVLQAVSQPAHSTPRGRGRGAGASRQGQPPAPAPSWKLRPRPRPTPGPTPPDHTLRKIRGFAAPHIHIAYQISDIRYHGLSITSTQHCISGQWAASTKASAVPELDVCQWL